MLALYALCCVTSQTYPLDLLQWLVLLQYMVPLRTKKGVVPDRLYVLHNGLVVNMRFLLYIMYSDPSQRHGPTSTPLKVGSLHADFGKMMHVRCFGLPALGSFLQSTPSCTQESFSEFEELFKCPIELVWTSRGVILLCGTFASALGVSDWLKTGKSDFLDMRPNANMLVSTVGGGSRVPIWPSHVFDKLLKWMGVQCPENPNHLVVDPILAEYIAKYGFLPFLDLFVSFDIDKHGSHMPVGPAAFVASTWPSCHTGAVPKYYLPWIWEMQQQGFRTQQEALQLAANFAPHRRLYEQMQQYREARRAEYEVLQNAVQRDVVRQNVVLTWTARARSSCACM